MSKLFKIDFQTKEFGIYEIELDLSNPEIQLFFDSKGFYLSNEHNEMLIHNFNALGLNPNECMNQYYDALNEWAKKNIQIITKKDCVKTTLKEVIEYEKVNEIKNHSFLNGNHGVFAKELRCGYSVELTDGEYYKVGYLFMPKSIINDFSIVDDSLILGELIKVENGFIETGLSPNNEIYFLKGFETNEKIFYCSKYQHTSNKYEFDYCEHNITIIKRKDVNEITKEIVIYDRNNII